MDKFNEALKLMKCFPCSFMNYEGEIIFNKKGNIFFRFSSCETELEIKCKVIEFLSRAAYKTPVYDSERGNKEFHRYMLKGINDYLNTNFDFDNIEIIYTYLGNGVNRPLTVAFIESGYDMNIIKEEVGNNGI